METIIIGNALDELKKMQDESVDVCVTSPPYWGLRDYGIEPTQYGEWKGQLGLEPNPKDYIEHLCMIFDEIHRILKPTGACWVNIADTYATISGSGFQQDNISPNKSRSAINGNPNGIRKSLKDYGFKSKSLCQIPSRFAIEMTDRGWILRNTIIWHKPNPMPTSVKDRFTNDYEMFYFFVKQQKYYFKQQFEPLVCKDIKSINSPVKHKLYGKPTYSGFAYDSKDYPQGKNCRTVWTIPTKGEKFSHIAMFPTKLIERPIDACCPDGGVVIDPFCGSGTVLQHCHNKNIDVIGIDIDPRCEDMIKARLDRKK